MILEGSKIEDESVIAPNSVVPPGRLIPSHQLWGGNPARYIRDLNKGEIWSIRVMAYEKYSISDISFDNAMKFNNSDLSAGTAYRLKENDSKENEELWRYPFQGEKHEDADAGSMDHK